MDGANWAGARARVQPTHRYAWRGRSLLVTNERLECGEPDGLTGYFFAETRHLHTLRLRVNDATPWLCAEGEGGHAELAAVYIYPELTHFEGGGTDMADDWVWRDQSAVTQRSIDIRTRLPVTPSDLVVVLTIANRSRQHVRLLVRDFGSPLAFVIALAHHFAWSGDRGFLQRHWDTARRILDWARERGDRDGDGYSRVSDEVARRPEESRVEGQRQRDPLRGRDAGAGAPRDV